ncbi:MAG: PLD nuclease N-terminal domain-containing protein [Desulfovibrio sp.]|nr:PLD nuclease N-terminal domain-containing protein [Desulfovibrio sp.]
MEFSWWYIVLAVLPLPNLWSIWHVWSHVFSSFQQKVSWLCIAVFFPVIGGLLYIAIGRKRAGERISVLRERIAAEKTDMSSEK